MPDNSKLIADLEAQIADAQLIVNLTTDPLVKKRKLATVSEFEAKLRSVRANGGQGSDGHGNVNTAA